MSLRAIADRARQLVRGGGMPLGGGAPRREQLADHDGPSFAAETDEAESDEAESWTAGFEQLTPAAPSATAYVPPLPPNPPLRGPAAVRRDCCLLAPGSLKDMTTMGGYATIGVPGVGRPGTLYTSKAGFVDLGHLLTVADVTAYAYQQIYANHGASGTMITVAHGTATLSQTAPATDWLELARRIAYDDSIAYEIETAKGITSLLPGHLNSAFSPEDLCSNYLGTVVAASALTSTSTAPFAERIDNEVRTLLVSLGARSATEARKAFDLKNHRWVEWVDVGSGLSPDYLRRRNFSNTPWLAGLPSDQPGAWAPTPFNKTTLYTYHHSSGFTNWQFGLEIDAIRAWLKAQPQFGLAYDQP
jgi:hypothetical protein